MSIYEVGVDGKGTLQGWAGDLSKIRRKRGGL